MRMNALAIAVGGALIASPAAAFDAWGFHSGMTIDEAKRAALPGQVVVRFAADLLEVNRPGEPEISLSFCRGRLASMARIISPERRWVEAIDMANKKFGTGVETVTRRRPNDGGDDDLLLAFNWRVGSDIVSVTYQSPRRSGITHTQSGGGAAEYYGSENACYKSM